MNFKAFYGLSCNPFDKHSLKISDSFESADQKSMMNRLSYLKDVRGIGVFTASPGMGKSFCLRQFESSLNKNLYDMKYVCLSTVSVGEFYKQLCDQLGLETKGGKTVMFKAIQVRIHYLYKEKKQPLILAIDEAQYLSNAVLKDLKMLMNFNYASLNCFTLILSGEPYLNNTLEKPVHEALRQRITVHYSFRGLGPDEIPAYIRHKIRLAGGADTLVGEDALSAVTGYCHGIPRIIDNVMSDAIMLGAQLGRSCIDSEVILAAVNEQALD